MSKILGSRNFLVLDIETAPSDFSFGVAGGGMKQVDRAALLEVTAATTLEFSRDAAGLFHGWAMTTFDGDGGGEVEILKPLQKRLDRAYQADDELVTFNGKHDLSVLARRAMRHWFFAWFCFPEWPTGGGPRHHDVMLRDPASLSGRWPNLIDACAGFGIDASYSVGNGFGPDVRPIKSETDCVATALLMGFALAREEGQAESIARFWSSMARWLANEKSRAPHLRNFWRHPFVEAADKLISK